MIDKFTDLTGPSMKKNQQSRIVDQVRELEKLEDIEAWSPVLLRH